MFNLAPESLASFIEKLPFAVACLDENRCYFALNQACVDINGITYENTIGKPVCEVVPDLEETITPYLDQVYLENKSINNILIEGKTPASADTRFWSASYQPLPLNNGKTGLLVTAEEITEKVFATKSADKNKKLLKDVLNGLFNFVGLLDEHGVILDTNKKPLDIAGITLEQVKGKPLWEAYWWSYSAQVQAKIKQAVLDVRNAKPVRFDIEAMTEFSFISIDLMMEGIYDPQGNLSNIIASAVDISERKKAEENLMLSQARFETVINRTIDGLVACDAAGIIHLANNKFKEMVEERVSVSKANIYDYLDDKLIVTRLKELIEYVSAQGIHTAIEKANINVHKDICFIGPNQYPVEVAFSPLLDGKEVLFLATISDVSELYEANQALESALKEKTVLLNEVHHRVKNNLQIMSSLLSLQANAHGANKRTKGALKDSQRRLKSMALIHQLLYERDDFTAANLQHFTDKLLDLLQESMSNANQITILKNFPKAPIKISLNQIVPYGFLITEIVTNAFKHAFINIDPGLHEATIMVSIQVHNDTIELIIADNGGGYSSNLKSKSTLGSDLIRIFTKQLRASLATCTKSGVRHTLRFEKT